MVLFTTLPREKIPLVGSTGLVKVPLTFMFGMLDRQVKCPVTVVSELSSHYFGARWYLVKLVRSEGRRKGSLVVITPPIRLVFGFLKGESSALLPERTPETATGKKLSPVPPILNRHGSQRCFSLEVAGTRFF